MGVRLPYPTTSFILPSTTETDPKNEHQQTTMSRYELELAQRCVVFAAKVHESKMKELEQAESWMRRLQNECQEAEQDVKLALNCLHKVEHKLRVVVIDDDQGMNDTPEDLLDQPTPIHQCYVAHEEPRSPSSPDPESSTTGYRGSQNNNNDGLKNSTSSLVLQVLSCNDNGVPLSASVRRALKRHYRKLLRVVDHDDKHRESES